MTKSDPTWINALPELGPGKPFEPFCQAHGGFNPKLQTVVLLCACHGGRFLHYLNAHRLDAANMYNFLWVDEGRLISESTHGFGTSDLWRTIREMEPIFVYQPTSQDRGELWTGHLLAGESEKKLTEFYVPDAGCFWPWLFDGGSLGVNRAKQKGMTRDEIWASYLNGTFEPCFEERLADFYEIVVMRDKKTDIRLLRLFHIYISYKKLYLSQNHPTTFMVGYMFEKILERLGMKARDEQQLITLGVNEDNMAPTFPDSPYAHKWYGFTWQPFAPPNDDFYWKELNQILGEPNA